MDRVQLVVRGCGVRALPESWAAWARALHRDVGHLDCGGTSRAHEPIEAGSWYRVHLNRGWSRGNGPSGDGPKAMAADDPLLHRRDHSGVDGSAMWRQTVIAVPAGDVRPLGEHSYSVRVRALRAGTRRH